MLHSQINLNKIEQDKVQFVLCNRPTKPKVKTGDLCNMNLTQKDNSIDMENLKNERYRVNYECLIKQNKKKRHDLNGFF